MIYLSESFDIARLDAASCILAVRRIPDNVASTLAIIAARSGDLKSLILHPRKALALTEILDVKVGFHRGKFPRFQVGDIVLVCHLDFPLPVRTNMTPEKIARLPWSFFHIRIVAGVWDEAQAWDKGQQVEDFKKAKEEYENEVHRQG